MDISVVIPVFNGEATIAFCLDSLVAQASRRPQTEIIVVDDCSTDRTREIVQSYSGVRYVFLSVNQGPAGARNNGVMESKGSIILFTDADCIPNADWINEMVEPFRKDSRVSGVKGVYLTKQNSFFHSKISMHCKQLATEKFSITSMVSTITKKQCDS